MGATRSTLRLFQNLLDTSFPLTPATKFSDVLRCGLDVVRIWLGCGLDVAQMSLGRLVGCGRKVKGRFPA